VTIADSDMQSGALATRTENRSQNSKTQHNTKSVANHEHKCAPILCIHVSFACNQQLAYCRATMTGCLMQRGAVFTRTENQKQTSKHNTTQNSEQDFEINAHSSVAFTSDLPAISSWHNSG
jgi:hypothetical protein